LPTESRVGPAGVDPGESGATLPVMAKRIAAADARRDFSEVVQQSSRGERIKLTRYGKTQAVLISARDLERLENCETADGGGTEGRRRR
jgi:prevent-host-death family protein